MAHGPIPPEKLKKPERVKSPEFAKMLRLSREHPCPSCHGRRRPCSTCNGSRVDPAFAEWE